jgi:hypothetical protein
VAGAAGVNIAKVGAGAGEEQGPCTEEEECDFHCSEKGELTQ